MNYYAYTKEELRRLGVQEDELSLFTGTVNPRQAIGLDGSLHTTPSQNAYVYLWRNGQPHELYGRFQRDQAGMEVCWTGFLQQHMDPVSFLRDKSSGYIRQIDGPASPIVVGNIGSAPLRVDTLLGKFTVHAGTMCRLDGTAFRRPQRSVLLTVSSRCGQPLESAEIWDGASWRRLNIHEEPSHSEGGRCLSVRDGGAIVQFIEVNEQGELLMPDSPEPDPDYTISIRVRGGGWVTLRFNRSDYRDGQWVQRVRTICEANSPYDLQKLRESPTEMEARRSVAVPPGGKWPWEMEADGGQARHGAEDAPAYPPAPVQPLWDAPYGSEPPEDFPKQGAEDASAYPPAPVPPLWDASYGSEPPEDFPKQGGEDAPAYPPAPVPPPWDAP